MLFRTGLGGSVLPSLPKKSLPIIVSHLWVIKFKMVKFRRSNG